MEDFKPSMFRHLSVPAEMKPKLMIVIDTEEEFDWDSDFSRDARSVENIQYLPKVFDALEPIGAVPLCVMTHPVMQNIHSAGVMRRSHGHGLCELGTHLHSWVNPPYAEEVNHRNSYACNLEKTLELRKMSALTSIFEQTFDFAPTMFRTGRYGVGANTFEVLAKLGYKTDLSLPPYSNFSRDGGPKTYCWTNTPFWAHEKACLLSLPVTTGFSGVFASFGPTLAPLLDSRKVKKSRTPGILARSKLLDRNRLTPEGVERKDLCDLMRTLVENGERVLTLSFHSSSLLPGATTYTKDNADVVKMITTLTDTLRYFVDELGGELAPVSAVDAELRGETESVCGTLRQAG